MRTTEPRMKEEHEVRTFPAEIRALDEATYTCTALVSTISPDRHGSIILPSAWDLENYRKNPIGLWAHKWHGDPQYAISTAQRVEVEEAEGLLAEMRYAVEANPMARLVWDLKAARVIRGYSPGFYVWDWVDQFDLQDERMKEKVDALPDFAREALLAGKVWEVITLAELIEISDCHIGSNPDALGSAVAAGLVPRELVGRALEDMPSADRQQFLRRMAGSKRPGAPVLGRKEEKTVETPAPDTLVAEAGATLENAMEGARQADEAREARLISLEEKVDRVLEAMAALTAPSKPEATTLEIPDEVRAAVDNNNRAAGNSEDPVARITAEVVSEMPEDQKALLFAELNEDPVARVTAEVVSEMPEDQKALLFAELAAE